MSVHHQSHQGSLVQFIQLEIDRVHRYIWFYWQGNIPHAFPEMVIIRMFSKLSFYQSSFMS